MALRDTAAISASLGIAIDWVRNSEVGPKFGPKLLRLPGFCILRQEIAYLVLSLLKNGNESTTQ